MASRDRVGTVRHATDWVSRHAHMSSACAPSACGAFQARVASCSHRLDPNDARLATCQQRVSAIQVLRRASVSVNHRQRRSGQLEAACQDMTAGATTRADRWTRALLRSAFGSAPSASSDRLRSCRDGPGGGGGSGGGVHDVLLIIHRQFPRRARRGARLLLPPPRPQLPDRLSQGARRRCVAKLSPRGVVGEARGLRRATMRAVPGGPVCTSGLRACAARLVRAP